MTVLIIVVLAFRIAHHSAPPLACYFIHSVPYINILVICYLRDIRLLACSLRRPRPITGYYMGIFLIVMELCLSAYFQNKCVRIA